MAETKDSPEGASSTQVASRESSPLTTSTGKTTIADTVVSKIAGIATREVNGVRRRWWCLPRGRRTPRAHPRRARQPLPGCGGRGR